MQAVKALQSYGYNFNVINGKIQYKFTGLIKPDRALVQDLLLQISEYKQEALAFLQAEAVYQARPPTIPQAVADLVKSIEMEALTLGWLPEQLQELQNTVKVFMPAKIGTICMQWIEIQTFWPDGKIRGSGRYYNMRVDQPWIKKGGHHG